MNPYLKRVENHWGLFSVEYSKNLPTKLARYAYLFPSSCRNPEIESFFHPSLRLKAILGHTTRTPRSLIRGIDAISRSRFGRFSYYKGQNESIITVVPKVLCKTDENQVTSAYLCEKDQIETSWLIFEEGLKTNSEFGKIEALTLYFHFLTSLFLTLFKKPSHIPFSDWMAAFLANLNWGLSCYWSDKISLERYTSELLSKNNKIKTIHCVHEFHPHSKVLWAIAERSNIKSCSIEHASNEREKLWLFPTVDEVKHSHPLPSSLFVYNEKHKKWWDEIFKGAVNYKYACGPRFSKWKEVSKLSPNSEKTILLVTSQSWWDNEVVFQSAEKLLQTNFDLTIRLHPFAQLRSEQRKWLENKISQTRLKVDKSDLMDSIKDHSIIIGMCSTVLDEALLLGRCAIKVDHDEFTSLGSSLAFQLNVKDVSSNEIERILSEYSSSSDGLVSLARENFGLEYNVACITN